MFTPDRPVVCCSSCPRGSSKSNIMDVVVHMLNCVGLVKNNKYYTGGTVLKFIRKSIESGNLIPLTHTYMTTQLTGLVRTDTLIKLAGLITMEILRIRIILLRWSRWEILKNLLEGTFVQKLISSTWSYIEDVINSLARSKCPIIISIMEEYIPV